MKSDDLERKLKIERVEARLNRQRFTQCDNIGRFVTCEEFVEVEHEKKLVDVRINECARLE